MGYVVLLLIEVARTRGDDLIIESGRANQFQAKLLAVGVEYRLNQFGEALTKTALDPEFLEVFRTGTTAELISQCEFIRSALNDEHNHYSDTYGNQRWPVANLFVVDAAGFLRAISPANPTVQGMNFSHRDYYKGIMQAGTMPNQFHISKVYKATGDGLYKFAVSAPIHIDDDPASSIAGLLVATFAISPTMGLEYFYDRDTVVSFAGPQDPNSSSLGVPGASVSTRYMLLLHPAYKELDRHSEPLTLTPPTSLFAAKSEDLNSLSTTTPVLLTSMNYYDPATAVKPERFGGRWVASYAPVGSTTYLVIVQRRYISTVEYVSRMVEPLFLGYWFLGLCSVLVLLIAIACRHRNQPPSCSLSGYFRQKLSRFQPLDRIIQRFFLSASFIVWCS